MTDATELDEVERLRRWKAEALPVIAGLQDLGRALELPLGERITGPAAVEAVGALRAALRATETEAQRARSEMGQWRRLARERVARAEAVESALDRVRRRHPRGDEEGGVLAPGLWCPTCGRERSENGYGACPDRAALATPTPADGNAVTTEGETDA